MTKNMFESSCIITLLLTVWFNSYSTGLEQNSSDIVGDDSATFIDGVSDNSEYVKDTPVKYNGAQILRISVTDESVKSAVIEIQSNYDGKLWMESGNEIQLLCMQLNVEDVQKIFTESNITYNVLCGDLQKAIDDENPPKEEIELLQNRKAHKMTWKAYHRLADIYGYLDYLGKTYPDLCSVSTIGSSSRNRALKMIKISNGNVGNPAIWIDGGIHAREWVSPASVTYIIKSLVEKWEDHPKYIRNIDWHILPVLNPDGYEYSHKMDRMWRKNRSGSGKCIGVDLNRNFGYKWGGEGTSTDPCSDIFPGKKANSEPETIAIQNYLSRRKNSFKAYLTFHSFGQYILHPYGYSKNVVPQDYKDLESLAEKAAAKILSIGGAKYKVGASGTLLRPGAGGSDDWTKAILGIKYSYTIELRGTKEHGFILPANMIEISGKEAMIIAETAAETVIKFCSEN